jgi:hypothetical protein
MIREDLVAERIAIDSYREMVRYLGDGDPTTRVMLEGILAKEEEPFLHSSAASVPDHWQREGNRPGTRLAPGNRGRCH